MRLFYLTVVFGLGVASFNSYEAKADCHLEGTTKCDKPCRKPAVCRAYYNPGPPETCETQCRNFFVRPKEGFTLKLEGVTESQKKKIEAILNEE